MYAQASEIRQEDLTPKPALLEYAVASHYRVVPMESGAGQRLLLATSIEQDEESYRHLRFLLRREFLFLSVDQPTWDSYVERAWSREERMAESGLSGLSSGFKAKVFTDTDKKNGSGVTRLSLADTSDNVPVIEQVDQLISRAISLGASDIHFEPYENELKVRFRIDGVLQPVTIVDKQKQAEMISRLKILARMDIAEKRRPQDGRIMVEGRHKTVDVRVSSMPTSHGEKMVLRLLDKTRQPLDLKALGMEGRNLELFNEAIRKPYGMILVTGPTGSGKTTTLYAALKAIHSTRINISTVEDPVEYQMPGINQTQMKSEIGYTFANAVRTFLRQDPDVIMIGEIRDPETAKYAIQAAQTGHLVFSTLHTNDAPSAIIRLLEMGMEPFLVAGTVHLIMAQRLVRKICASCRHERPITPEEKKYLGNIGEDITAVFEGPGCDNCAGTGYKGRIGIFEIMPVSIAIQELVNIKASTQKVLDRAVEEGMRKLKTEGVRLVREGGTSVAEVKMVVG